MAIVNGYADLDEFKSWIDEDLDVADANARLEHAVETASRWIDAYCDRRFYPDPADVSDPPVARTFDACDRWDLRIDDATTVTQIATDNDADGDYETVWAAGDWQAITYTGSVPETRPYRRIRALNGRSFPRPRPGGRVLLVEVTARWGWPAVPDAIHTACLMQAGRLLKRRKSPEGITGFGNEFGHMRITRQGDPDVAALLDPYSLKALVA